MIDFTTSLPLQDAVAQLSGRTPLGSTLSSAEWALVPAEIRLRSMFSSRIECERILAEAQARLQQRLLLERSTLPDGGVGVTMDRRRFIDEMRGVLVQVGYQPHPKKVGTLQDLTSTGRLGLIWQMNLDQAQGFAQWKAGMSEVALLMWPAMELVRLENRRERRPWPEQWVAAGGTFHGAPGADYPGARGRMIALKTDPVWMAVNRFGVPWKPFDWGSGMGTRNISRREALALGLIQESDAPQTPQRLPYNKAAEASLVGISPARRRAIEDSMLGDVEIEGDIIRLLPPQGGDTPFILPAVAPRALAAASALSADATAQVMQAARRTVAYQRLAARAADVGQPVDEAVTVARAVAQYLDPAAAEATRLSDMRDAAWSASDFAEIKGILESVLGGDVA